MKNQQAAPIKYSAADTQKVSVQLFPLIFNIWATKIGPNTPPKLPIMFMLPDNEPA